MSSFDVIDDPERLAALRRTALLDTPNEEAFDRLTKLASRILAAPISLVSLVDEEREFFKSCVGLPEPGASARELPLSHSFCKHLVATGEPLIIEDARTEPLVWDNPAIPAIGVIAYAGIPLITSDGHTLGSFCVIDTKPRVWMTEEIEVLKELATSAMTEIELRIAMRSLQRAHDELETRVAERTVELTRSSDQLRDLSLRLVNLQEIERRRLARELHDEVGQVLTGLKLLLDTSISQPSTRVTPIVEEASGLVSELIVQVRDLSQCLRPAMLDDQGLLAALQWQVHRFSSQTGMTIRFEHAGLERRLGHEVETAAYRIVQEALTNIARHADVREAHVEIWADDVSLGIQVEDQGRGFDVGAVLASGMAYGLGGMKERVALLGGELTLNAEPGVGTRLFAELPLE